MRTGRFTKPFIAAAATLLVGMANPDQALACRTAIGDFVWVDSNGNGVQDAGEPGINGVRLVLATDDPKYIQGVGIFETVTANHPVTHEPGWYSFQSIGCGHDYTVSVDAATVPAGYVVTTIGAGSDPASDSNNPGGATVHFPIDISVNPPPDLTLDFGYLPPCTGAIGDFVWNDLNRDGLQDAGEPGIAGALVELNGNAPVATGANGGYLFGGLCGGTHTICVQVPAGYQISPANAGNDALDSDGVSNSLGKSCAAVTLSLNETNLTTDFGFNQPPVRSPGTGTPGYWKNHPEVWSDVVLVIGGISYTQAQILPYLEENPKDKTTTIFRALVAAMLNVLIGNDDSCVASTISAANTWLANNGPVGAGVRANSAAWRQGEPLYRVLDNYNNGMLCAPARD
jgi:hypothetical protein